RVFGLSIQRFSGDGILAATDHNFIESNVISGNTGNGITISSNDNLVQGNSIGTDASGKSALGNYIGISVEAAGFNTIGGTASGARNIISGNNLTGLQIDNNARFNFVEGNSIGTDVSGKLALGNSIGISIEGAAESVIGGTASGARNIISGNKSIGLQI